jgi:hypothetical protein
MDAGIFIAILLTPQEGKHQDGSPSLGWLKTPSKTLT